MNDAEFMSHALDLARRGEGHVAPNPMVGAVVVKDGSIVGEGWHEAIGKPHAEINAMNAAGRKARDAELYVTLEPCNHAGRTPPCTEAILQAGIRRVVAAMRDPNPRVTGGGIDYLRQRGLAVEVGICEASARRLNEAFVKYITTGCPFVVVKCAATLDGRIATRSGDARWISGEASRQYVHRLRHALDAILVGIETVKADDPSLTTRIAGFAGKDPRRIILDTHLTISENARLLNLKSDAGTILVVGPSVSTAARQRMLDAGAEVLPVRLSDGRIDLKSLMQRLGEKSITSVLIEGGGAVIGSALRAGIVDKLVLFYAPRMLGGDDGVPICRGSGAERVEDGIQLERIEVRRFGADVMIEGYIQKP
ncbi:MAG TPA: bifunctional diaminohydroxyphosphoribosylaminopyrimidine deaminase/5-amino-6-(5-phosphoribosylamino)uracil reductase RibD [Desulfobacterales bacterium]